MEIALKIVIPFCGIIGLLYAAFWLGGNKKKKSDNTRGDYDNRAAIAEDWLNRLEKTTDLAGRHLQTKEEYKSMILEVLRKGEMHFNTCANPEDDFKIYLAFLSKRFNKNV